MEKKLYCLFVIITMFISQGAAQTTNEEPIKILFVGNSFMFFWNMPQLVQTMAIQQGVSIKVKQSTVSGSNLEQHWKSEKGTKTRELLEEEHWDYVILGDHSRSAIDTPERFKEYNEKFVHLIRSKGATPVFYMTWAYKSNPLMQKTITTGYKTLAKELDAKTLEIGPILMRARTLRPDLEFFFDDKHTSSDGSYLIALAITKWITGISVKNVSNRVTRRDIDGEKIYLSFVLPKIGTFLRQLADETVNESIILKK